MFPSNIFVTLSPDSGEYIWRFHPNRVKGPVNDIWGSIDMNRSRVYSTPERHFEYSAEYAQVPLDLSLSAPAQPIIAVNTVEFDMSTKV